MSFQPTLFIMPHPVTIFFLVEIAGTIAFACSGAMVAVRKQLDLLGIIVLGVTTAVDRNSVV